MKQTEDIDYLAPESLNTAIGLASEARSYYLSSNIPPGLSEEMLDAAISDPAFAGRSLADQVAILKGINENMQRDLSDGISIDDRSSYIKTAIPNISTAGSTKMTSAFDMLLAGQYGDITAGSDADSAGSLDFNRNLDREQQQGMIAKVVQSHAYSYGTISLADIQDELGFEVSPEQAQDIERQLEDLTQSNSNIDIGNDFSAAPQYTATEPAITPQPNQQPAPQVQPQINTAPSMNINA